MQRYSINPTDLLFFRDGRPMETGEGSGGHGARWPLPTIFFDALHAALHRAFPSDKGTQSWEVLHPVRGRNGRGGEMRFGSLRTVGPYPRDIQGRWWFPAPLDVRPGPENRLHAMRILPAIPGGTNLPSPLSAMAASGQPPTKLVSPPWWSPSAYEAYLESGIVDLGHSDEVASDFWTTEWTTGIGTDPSRDAQDGARIYSASYLRMKPGVTMGCGGSLPDARMQDALCELFPDDGHIVCGGQQRVCRVERETGSLEDVMPRSAKVNGDRVKWVLLAPALFPKSPDHPGGWLPSWVNPESGQVHLPVERAERRPGESRSRWRRRWNSAAPLDVRLVAACVGKPVVMTGWSDFLKTPESGEAGCGKATRLAVPSGSVYYFEGGDAPALADLLSWHGNDSAFPRSRSGALGEKGLGLGVTGPWELF